MFGSIQSCLSRKGDSINLVGKATSVSVARELANELSNQPHLVEYVETAFLGDNVFNDEVLDSILTTFSAPRQTTLKALHLQFCNLANADISVLAKHLYSLPDLKVLSLGGNHELGNYAILELVKVFHGGAGRKLENLNLCECNRVSLDGVVALANVMGKLSNLKYLHFAGCSLNYQEVKVLVDVLERSGNLVKIEFDREKCQDSKETTALLNRAEWLGSMQGNWYRRGQAWNPQSHRGYPESTRQRVYVMMMLNMVDENADPIFPSCPVYVLPKELLFMIFQNLVVSRDFVDVMVQQWMKSSS